MTGARFLAASRSVLTQDADPLQDHELPSSKHPRQAPSKARRACRRRPPSNEEETVSGLAAPALVDVWWSAALLSIPLGVAGLAYALWRRSRRQPREK